MLSLCCGLPVSSLSTTVSEYSLRPLHVLHWHLATHRHQVPLWRSKPDYQWPEEDGRLPHAGAESKHLAPPGLTRKQQLSSAVAPWMMLSRRLPVLDKEGKLVGVISRRNIIVSALAERRMDMGAFDIVGQLS